MSSSNTPTREPARPFTNQDLGVFGGMQIIPVPSDHEYAPSAGTVNINADNSRCYVLDSEWPSLEAALRAYIKERT